MPTSQERPLPPGLVGLFKISPISQKPTKPGCPHPPLLPHIICSMWRQDICPMSLGVPSQTPPSLASPRNKFCFNNSVPCPFPFLGGDPPSKASTHPQYHGLMTAPPLQLEPLEFPEVSQGDKTFA